MSAAPPPLCVPLPNRRATRLLARALASALCGGDLIVLSGGLGAGKTFLVRALARALGLPASVRVLSPTFPLLRTLETDPVIAHADLYRLGSAREADDLGLVERRDLGEVLIVEWGERFRDALGPDGLTVHLQREPRAAKVTADGARSVARLAVVSAALPTAMRAPPGAPGDPSPPE